MTIIRPALRVLVILDALGRAGPTGVPKKELLEALKAHPVVPLPDGEAGDRALRRYLITLEAAGYRIRREYAGQGGVARYALAGPAPI